MTEPEPAPVDPYAAVDYPAEYPNPPAYPGYPALPPPVYPAPYPGPAEYPPPPPGQYSGQFQGQFQGQPYDPYRPAAPPGVNGKAIGALITALLGVPMCLCFIPSLVAIALGLATMTETKRSGQQGHGLALAAVIIGAATIVGGTLFMLLSVANV